MRASERAPCKNEEMMREGKSEMPDLNQNDAFSLLRVFIIQSILFI